MKALLFSADTVVSTATSLTIPLVQGLTLVGAVSERQGSYESTCVLDGVDADGTLRIETSAEFPDSAGGKPKPVSFDRDVSGNDRDHVRTHHTTALGTDVAVFHNLRTVGNAFITLHGQISALGNLIGSFLNLIPGAHSKSPAELYFSGSGAIRTVESNPSSIR